MSPSPVEKILESTDGTAIYAEAIGNPANPSLVLVHGFSMSSAVYDILFADERLLESAHLVRYDLRGHGRSGKPETPESYASALFAADFAAVTKAFDLTNPIFVGWSYGGSIAGDVCAHLRPNPLAAIVYLGAIPLITPEMMQVVPMPAVGQQIPALCGLADAAAYRSAKIDFVDKFFKEPERVDFRMRTTLLGTSLLQPPVVSYHVLSRVQEPEPLFEAGRQGLPTLIVTGTADRIVHNENVIQALKPHFISLQLKKIEGAHHALLQENAEDVIPAIVAFTKEVQTKAKQ